MNTVLVLFIIAVVATAILVPLFLRRAYRKDVAFFRGILKSPISDLDEEEETFIADYYDEMRYKRKQIQ